MLIKAIVFDKDGVLVDLNATWLASAWVFCHDLAALSEGTVDAHFFAELFGVTESGFDTEYSLFAAGDQAEMYDAIVQNVPILENKISDSAVKRKLEKHMLESAVPVSLGDVRSSFKVLHDQGYLLAILTNDNAEFTQQCIDVLKIADFVSTVMTADAGFGGKPNPTGLLEICRRLDVSVDEVMMVGDTEADLLVAQNADIAQFVVVADQEEIISPILCNADHRITQIDALPTLLQKY